MNDRILPVHEVDLRSGMSPVTRWREQKVGRFPPFEQISERRKGLRESTFEEWLDGRRDWAGEANRVRT